MAQLLRRAKSLKHICDKRKFCLVLELHVNELFKLKMKIMKRSCGNKNHHEYISEQEITDTINTGNTKKLCRQNKLPTKATKNEKGSSFFIN